MNPFEKHGIAHLSASSLNAARSSQAYWLISYLAKIKDSGSIAMLAGQAAEEAVSRKLFNPDMPTDECVGFAAKIFKQKTALGGHDPEDRESKLEEIVGRVADGRKKAFDGMVRNAIVALSPYAKNLSECRSIMAGISCSIRSWLPALESMEQCLLFGR